MKLRGHHLICLHFFKGEGYSSDFVANLFELLKRAEEGEKIEAIDSADDVCIECPHLKDRKCHYREGFEKEIREMDARAFELLGTAKGTKTTWRETREILPKIFKDWANRYCRDCDWKTTCQESSSWLELAR